ncbi:cysteine hydrolase family protein [Isoptericola cucumis]|uniref:Isochorismatase n=1 Tax=Isoptericola cucumis TaxID=1776856 RepID=A0ABQ2B6F5_9MICO|nr:cysteine hydrolase [Isoptericola cucumis]GGI06780.1 isochorismatase [Isoptericola cucumis]
MSSGGGASHDAWLVAVDMQRVFADPPSPWSSPDFPAALSGVRRLLPAFPGRVAYTRYVAPSEPRGAWADYFAAWPFALVPPDDPLYDLVDGLDPGGAPVVTAATFGKWGPELAAATGGAGTLVVAGVSTDCCVLSTVLAAADAGRHVRVVADACAGASRADHERALDTMRLYAPLVEVTTVAEVLGDA